MTKITCKKAHKAAVISRIKRVNNSKKITKTEFNSVIAGIYESGLSTPEGPAKQFQKNVSDTRNWSKRHKGPNLRTQKRVIEFVAKAHGIV